LFYVIRVVIVTDQTCTDNIMGIYTTFQ